MYATPSKAMWNLVESNMRTQRINRGELARRICVHPNTITKDSQEPERIPQGRLWLYFEAVGIPVEDVLKTTISEFV